MAGFWDGPQDRPGGDDSLQALYLLVEAAEQEDLAEQVYLDELRLAEEERWRWILREILGEDGDEQEVPEPPDEDDEEPSGFTLAQVIAMLQHYLGAEVVEPSDGPERRDTV